ncbi:OB-fold protein [Arachidicoccus sp.]|uniref:OB-fold protein n=1 Tax=Arachidicoccus sp. TaxID=1872624 RepID=UPI003D19861E
MKRKRAFLTVVIIIFLLGMIGATWGWIAYHKTRPMLSSIKADAKITSEELYSAFSTNENNANKLYLNKIVEVSGSIASVQQDKTQTTIELQAGNDALGGINCAMRNVDNSAIKGQTIKIKGRCIGFLMDVNLVDAVIVK